MGKPLAGVGFQESSHHDQDGQSGQAQAAMGLLPRLAFPPSLVRARQGTCDQASCTSRVTTGRGLDMGCSRGSRLTVQLLNPRGTTIPAPQVAVYLNRTPGTTEVNPQSHTRLSCWPRWGLPTSRAMSSAHTLLPAPSSRAPVSLCTITKLVLRPRASSGRQPHPNLHVSLQARPSHCAVPRSRPFSPSGSSTKASDLGIRPSPCSITHWEEGGEKGRGRPAGPG